MRACILTIGNEILKGKTVNTNAAEIGRFLYFSGYEVYRVLTVPDVKEEIGEGFRSLIGKCDVIVSSGGLGPTFDDMTVSSFAEEFKIPLVLDEEVYNIIKSRAEGRGHEMSKERKKMALIPKGSRIVKNEVGSAPGIFLVVGNTKIYILPGVPAEMRSMLKLIVEEIKLKDSFHFEESVLLKGVFEATLAPYVTVIMNKYDGGVYIKSHPMLSEKGEPCLEVEVSAKSVQLEKSRKLVKEVIMDIKTAALTIGQG